MVRAEQEEDFGVVEAINAAAFEREEEAQLVRNLRPRPGTLSLVAVEQDEVVGHILFSTVTVDGQQLRTAPLGLGPMSVLPARQNGGIGSALVEAGLQRCRADGVPFVVVLGHPEYYPRFGFRPAGEFGLQCPWSVPEEVFMALELEPGALAGIAGTVRYAPAFRL